jgi:hypothetical protein
MRRPRIKAIVPDDLASQVTAPERLVLREPPVRQRQALSHGLSRWLGNMCTRLIGRLSQGQSLDEEHSDLT